MIIYGVEMGLPLVVSLLAPRLSFPFIPILAMDPEEAGSCVCFLGL